jgi:HEAT repeat protein
MEETRIRDEPSSINSLVRLLDASDDAVRAVAALGLGFLTSRVQQEEVDSTHIHTHTHTHTHMYEYIRIYTHT